MLFRSRAPQIDFSQGSALDLPYSDNSFDMVFTSGVLIHIGPEDLPTALGQIHRCAKQHIFGSEYYSPTVAELNWRQENNLMWKMDYAREYLTLFDDLALVRERQLPYLDSDNVDSVFLLRKTR